MTKKSEPPFFEYINDLQKNYNLNKNDAILRARDHYEAFKNRNERLLERQNDAANTASVNLLNQVTLLATATLTFGGAFVATLHEDMTDEHTVLFLVIVFLELITLTFALIEYKVAINFHHRWTLAYYNIDQKVEKRLEMQACKGHRN